MICLLESSLMALPVISKSTDAGEWLRLMRLEQETREKAQELLHAFAQFRALYLKIHGENDFPRGRIAFSAPELAFLADHAKWAKRFPDEFYQEIFRLRGWQWQGMRVNRPQVVGHYTNDIVWDRLAPRVREELEQLNPKTEKGTRRVKHHQWLTYDIGHPALQKHLTGVIALMKSVRSSPHKAWTEFQRRLQRVFPKVNTNLELQFPDEDFDDA